MADAQACSLNKNTTQYGGHFVFVFFGFRFFWPVMFACLLARLFSDFVLFISFLLLHFDFWLPWRVFSLDFFFRIVFNAARVGDATSSRTAAASHAILRIGPSRRAIFGLFTFRKRW